MGIPWAEIVPDAVGSVGVLVAGWAAWTAGRAAEKANAIADRAVTVNQTLADIEAKALDASQAVAAIEDGRRRIERTPRLSATLTAWGDGQSGYLLAVWLDSSEKLGHLRVMVSEARNNDGPIGFKRSQDGVPNELPPDLEAEGIRPAWSADSLSPIAEWPKPKSGSELAPGDSVVWRMELRNSHPMSAGVEAVRFKALAWLIDELDGQPWELPLPVEISETAKTTIADTGNRSQN